MTTRLRSGLADLAMEARPVDLRARVRDGALRITRRNRALAGVAGVCVVAAAITALIVLRPTGSEPQPGTSPASTAPATPTVSPTPVVPDIDLRSATLTVPAYPQPFSDACPAGQRTFVDGVADASPLARLVLANAPQAHGDIDGQPGAETVIMVQCATEGASGPNPLAVRVNADSSVTVLGWVNVDPDGELLVLDPAEPILVADGAVTVVVLYRPDAVEDIDKQTRSFAYRDGMMMQVDGPTTFPPAGTDADAIDLNNSTIFIWADTGPAVGGKPSAYYGYMNIINGSGTGHLERLVDGTKTGNVLTTVTVEQTLVVPTGARRTPVAVLELRPADDGPRSVVMAYHHGASGFAARYPVTVYTTPAGAAVPSVTATPDQLSVATSEGARTFRFSGDSLSPDWFEV